MAGVENSMNTKNKDARAWCCLFCRLLFGDAALLQRTTLRETYTTLRKLPVAWCALQVLECVLSGLPNGQATRDLPTEPCSLDPFVFLQLLALSLSPGPANRREIKRKVASGADAVVTGSEVRHHSRWEGNRQRRKTRGDASEAAS